MLVLCYLGPDAPPPLPGRILLATHPSSSRQQTEGHTLFQTHGNGSHWLLLLPLPFLKILDGQRGRERVKMPTP